MPSDKSSKKPGSSKPKKYLSPHSGQILRIRQVHPLTNHPLHEPAKKVDRTAKKWAKELPRVTDWSRVRGEQPQTNFEQQERWNIKTAQGEFVPHGGER